MNFSQFLLILRARIKIVAITLLVTVSLTVVVSLLLPKTYKATCTLLMNYKGVDPFTGMMMPGQMMSGYMATQIDIITSKSLALRVIDQLKLASSPSVIARFQASFDGKGTISDWLAGLLVKQVEVSPSRESSVLEISFKGADPQFAATMANAYADEYQKMSLELKVEPMKKASTYFYDQTKILRDNVEAAQSKMSKYQQEHGIVSEDNRLDIETTRLSDLSAQLVAAQGQTMEATSRQKMAQSSVAGDSPDVAANPLVQSMKAALGTAEGKLADLGQRLDKNHPQYQSAKAEVDKLRADLNAQLQSASNSIGNNAEILQHREAALRAAVAAQKEKVLELNRTRDEMGVLSKDVESAQRAYDVASQRFSQTKIEGQVDQSDISVLNPAAPPLEPASPKVLTNTFVSILLGTMLGLAFAMLAEFMDRRVRSAEDLVEALKVPVLGMMDWKPPKRRRIGWFNRVNRTLQDNLKLS